MPGRNFSKAGIKSQLVLALVLCALFARAWIPAGWMPDRTSHGYAINLCTGMGAMTAWVDEEGKVHKNKPLRSGGDDQPCAFAGLFNVAALPDVAGALAILPAAAVAPVLPVITITVGRGLAAPPPPPTGPPAIL